MSLLLSQNALDANTYVDHLLPSITSLLRSGETSTTAMSREFTSMALGSKPRSALLKRMQRKGLTLEQQEEDSKTRVPDAPERYSNLWKAQSQGGFGVRNFPETLVLDRNILANQTWGRFYRLKDGKDTAYRLLSVPAGSGTAVTSAGNPGNQPSRLEIPKVVTLTANRLHVSWRWTSRGSLVWWQPSVPWEHLSEWIRRVIDPALRVRGEGLNELLVMVSLRQAQSTWGHGLHTDLLALFPTQETPITTRYHPPGRTTHAKVGKLWADWGHTLDDENKTDWETCAGDLSYMKSTNLPGAHKMARPRETFSANSWAVWTLMKIIYEKDKMLGNKLAIWVQNQRQT
ncbi:hypothetical protein BHE90_005665 [Fusarium euwallaceae]|uniref:Uncharacterized protein n=1 Tax=Fusarium euwallaceae TaxID=1147111 RepID=A0A430LVS5_9HYPO|nr:hypothetical protein BHE90_005665 [Fusarium euwallaceae]